MEDNEKMPEIKQILGALIFGANRALKVSELKKCLVDAAAADDAEAMIFAKVKDRDIVASLQELEEDLRKAKAGFLLREVAGGYMLHSDASCGKWLKILLDKGRPDRLSRPALETLSIVAYRQPVSKSSIEAIRGVDVGHMIKMLMEMQLVRITGRSELPGKPFLYGTTSTFLEHFGLKDLNELSSIEPMLSAAGDDGKTKVRSGKGHSDENAEVLELISGKDDASEEHEPVLAVDEEQELDVLAELEAEEKAEAQAEDDKELAGE